MNIVQFAYFQTACTAVNFDNIYQICYYFKAFAGSTCEEDANGCDYIACLNNAECTDAVSPGAGVLCPPCTFVNIYNGTKCGRSSLIIHFVCIFVLYTVFI